MPEQRSAADYLPARISLKTLRTAVHDCRGCDLYARATHAVFGEGLRRAEMFLVGEQPGDREDLEARPFVGPAGRLLDRALTDAGVDRRQVYVTNAVKHFKWEPRGKRRIHSKPNAAEIRACHPWLEAELRVVRPTVLMAMGATAARSLFGPAFRVTAQRGTLFRSDWAEHSMGTVHPSSILRAPGSDAREQAMARFVADLKAAAAVLAA